MLQVKNSLVNTQNGGIANNVIAKTSMTSVDCTNVVSPTFTTCTGDYNASSDTTAVGANSLISQPISSWFTNAASGDYSINTTGQTALAAQGWNGSDIVGWAYVTQTGAGTLTGFAISSVSFNGHIIDIASSTASLISAMTASASAVDVSKSNGTVKTSPLNSNGQIVAVDSLHGALALQVVIPGHVLTPKTIASAVLSAISASGLIGSSGLVNASLLTPTITASATTNTINKSTGNIASTVNSNGQIVAVDSLHGALALQVVIPGHVLTPKTIASAVLSAISASGLLTSVQKTQGNGKLDSSVAKASTTLITPTNSALVLDATKVGKSAIIDYQNINVRSGSLIVQVLLSNKIIENLKSNQINI